MAWRSAPARPGRTSSRARCPSRASCRWCPIAPTAKTTTWTATWTSPLIRAARRCADGSELDPQCSDGIDNDSDGDIDWPEDLECGTPDDTTEGGLPACSDGVDNDGDALIDALDSGCTSSTDCTEVQLGVCQDGIDNDADALVDYPADPGCHSVNDDTEFDLTEGDIRSRLMLLFDTSGSMNWNSCTRRVHRRRRLARVPRHRVACSPSQHGCDRTAAPTASRTTPPGKAKQASDRGRTASATSSGPHALSSARDQFACRTRQRQRRRRRLAGCGRAPCSGWSRGDVAREFDPENTIQHLCWSTRRLHELSGHAAGGHGLRAARRAATRRSAACSARRWTRSRRSAPPRIRLVSTAAPTA